MTRLLRTLLIGTFVFTMCLFNVSWRTAFAQPLAPLARLGATPQELENASNDKDKTEQVDDSVPDVEQDMNVDMNEAKEDLDAASTAHEIQASPDVDEVNGNNTDVDDREMDQKDDLQTEVDEQLAVAP